MKGGVMLGDFFSDGVAQFDLFAEYQPRHNSGQLMALIDKMNARQRGALCFAGQGIQKPWSMKREMLAPAYITRLADSFFFKLRGKSWCAHRLLLCSKYRADLSMVPGSLQPC
ncbi:DUF4113 domain-containing protein [Pantoea sp. DY-17]|nr:DUF4113 domain-containing protein [Pantoea sp. DY-17]